MRLDHASMLLEIFSFFLVTIDLYGRDRLNSAHLQIKTLLAESAKRTKPKYAFTIAEKFFATTLAKENLGCTMWILTPLFIAPLMIPMYYDQVVREYVDSIYVLSVFITLSVCVIIVFPFFVLYALLWTVSEVSGLISKILNRIRIDGLFLFIGTVCFLLSKTLAYLATR